MLERVRWDRRKNQWGILYHSIMDGDNLCDYYAHFNIGLMHNATTHVEPTTVRGCAPHTSIVGFAYGDLVIGARTGIEPDSVSVKFDGSDFFAGTQLVKHCVKMFFFKDGTCMAEGIS